MLTLSCFKNGKPNKGEKMKDKKINENLLDDATKGEVSQKEFCLLQWGWKKLRGHSFPSHSLQMPADVVDLILSWRDKERDKKVTTKQGTTKEETLKKVIDEMSLVSDDLRSALNKATPTEFLVLLPIRNKLNEARKDAGALLNAIEATD
jgi:hypothetical protein